MDTDMDNIFSGYLTAAEGFKEVNMRGYEGAKPEKSKKLAALVPRDQISAVS
jgi:hypothetical protein